MGPGATEQPKEVIPEQPKEEGPDNPALDRGFVPVLGMVGNDPTAFVKYPTVKLVPALTALPAPPALAKEFEQLVPTPEARRREIRSALYDFENAFGINIPEASTKNLAEMRARLGALTPQEEQLLQTFSQLPLTLKHATCFLEPAQAAGAIMSLQERGRRGDLTTNHRGGTGWSNGDDYVYFVIGTGDHTIPDYLLSMGGDVISVPVDDKLLGDGLWIGPHLSTFHGNHHLQPIQFGDTVRSIRHVWRTDPETLEETIEKTYHYRRADGAVIQQSFGLGDEIFAERDIVPGMALKLIEDLRNIGGEYQRYILGQARNPNFLQDVFNAHFESWDYPEARLPTRLSLNTPGISIQHYEVHPKLEDFYGAAGRNDCETLRRLIKDGIPVDAAFQDQRSALLFATKKGCNEAVLTLLEHGASPAHLVHDFKTANVIDYIAAGCNSEVTAHCIRMEGAKHPKLENIKGLIGAMPGLFELLYRKHEGTGVDLLIRSRNDYSYEGCDVVNLALLYQRYDHALLLLERGAHASSTLESGPERGPYSSMNPLMMLASQPQANEEGWPQIREVVEQLLAHGCPIDERFISHMGFTWNKTDNGRTALYMAVESGNYRMAQLLLQNGADPNISTHLGRTPLNLAENTSLSLGTEMGELLRQYGAISRPAIIRGSKNYWDPRKCNFSVAAVVLAEVKGRTSVLMGRKRDPLTRELGPYLFPGGERDYSDPTGMYAAQRETLEETGINPRGMLRALNREGKLLHRIDVQGPADANSALQSGKRHETYVFNVGNLGGVSTRGRDDMAMSRMVPLSELDWITVNGINRCYVRENSGELVPVLQSNGCILNALDPSTDSLQVDRIPEVDDALYHELHGPHELVEAILNRDTAEIDRLLSLGFDINRSAYLQLPQEFGENRRTASPFTAAVAIGDTQLMHALYERGANVDNGIGCQVSSTYFAVKSKAPNRLETMRILLELGGAVDGARDDASLCVFCPSPLMEAMKQSDNNMARVLLEGGAEPNLIDKYGGDTALRYAITSGNIEGVQLLLDAGAKINFHYLDSGTGQMEDVFLTDEAIKIGSQGIIQLLGQVRDKSAGKGVDV